MLNKTQCEAMEKIKCPRCGTVYKIPSEKLLKSQFRAKCNRCGTSFSINASASTKQNPPERENEAAKPYRTKYAYRPILGNSEPDRSRDYVAIAIILVALTALLFFGYMSLKTILKGDFLGPVKTLTDRAVKEVFFGSPHDKNPSKTDIRYESVLATGHKYFNRKNYKKALEYYGLAVRLRPHKAEPLYWQARALENSGKRTKAIEQLERVLKVDPEYVAAYNRLGWIYTKSKKWNKAIEHLDKAIELDPNNGWAYYNRGRCYFKLGQSDKALANAKKACELGFELGCRVYKKYKK